MKKKEPRAVRRGVRKLARTLFCLRQPCTERATRGGRGRRRRGERRIRHRVEDATIVAALLSMVRRRPKRNLSGTPSTRTRRIPIYRKRLRLGAAVIIGDRYRNRRSVVGKLQRKKMIDTGILRYRRRDRGVRRRNFKRPAVAGFAYRDVDHSARVRDAKRRIDNRPNRCANQMRHAQHLAGIRVCRPRITVRIEEYCRIGRRLDWENLQI